MLLIGTCNRRWQLTPSVTYHSFPLSLKWTAQATSACSETLELSVGLILCLTLIYIHYEPLVKGKKYNVNEEIKQCLTIVKSSNPEGYNHSYYINVM